MYDSILQLTQPQLQNLKKLGVTVYLLFHRQASWIQFSSPLSLFCSFILQTWFVGKVIVPLGTGRLTNVKFLVLNCQLLVLEKRLDVSEAYLTKFTFELRN